MGRKLAGKVALVTGGTRGIGAGTVRRLCADGAQVIFTGSDARAAAKVSADGGALFQPHRIEDAAAWPELVAMIRERFGRLDIVFANAAVDSNDSNAQDIELEAWQRALDINLTGTMLTVQHGIRAMAANPGGARGSIIVNSSMNALRPMGDYLAYSVTKSAVVALAKSAALHCAAQGHAIRVNAILPGVIETDLIRDSINRTADPQAARAIFEGMSPMQRMGQVDEVAALVAFLASDEASFINGGEYVIDGATITGIKGVS